MSIIDKISIILMVGVLLFIINRFIQAYKKEKGIHWIYYSISFGVMAIAGILLIILGFEVLSSPLIIVVASIVPLGLATGLISEFHPSYETPYVIFATAGLLFIALTRFVVEAGEALAISTVHTIAGLTIIAVPVLAVLQDKTVKSFIWVSVGGSLIGIGGIALTLLKAGYPILSEATIFSILAPLLLLMTLSYTYGFWPTVRDVT